MKTEIIVITDRSGSMESISNEVIGGYNKFIEDQKQVPGEAKVTFCQFDNVYDVVYAGIDIKDVPLLTSETFVPRGMTALFDAVGKTLEQQGKRIAEDKWADMVVVYIITDGAENASREYTPLRVQEMTKHAESNGWVFIFLAANMDAVAAAKSFGSTGQYASNFIASAAGTMDAYDTTSTLLRSMRTQ